MTLAIGKMTDNKDPRVVAAINSAAEFDAAGRPREAIATLMSIVVDFPKSSAVHGYLAWYLSTTGQHQDARWHSSESVTLSPRSERASLIHFHVLHRAGLINDAMAEMRRFLKLKPESEGYAKILRASS